MGSMTSAGSTIAIAAATPATFDEAGYEAVAGFATIGEVTDYGELGRSYALVTHNPVATRGTVKKKGSFNEGAQTLQLALDDADAGQILARAALASDADYSFRLTMQNGAKRYFQAQVMSFNENVGSVDQITAATIVLEITTTAAGVGIVRAT